MTQGELVCPKCKGQMQEGFIFGYPQYGLWLFGHPALMVVSAWVEGAPERSFWRSFGTGIRLKGKKKIPPRTYRCSSCGYLESYAK